MYVCLWQVVTLFMNCHIHNATDEDESRYSMMSEEEVFCVVCGESVAALFNQYGPHFLKVTSCERCGSVADKYIEYDPAIVMLDIILLSKEAYRHVLFNTPFKSYWKLFILLLFMESYLNWSDRHGNKEKMTEVCIIQNHTMIRTNDESALPRYKSCALNIEDADPFMMEKGIYVTFCFICCGMVAFIISSVLLSIIMVKGFNHKRKVKLELFIKMITIGGLGNFLMLPTLIWGNENDNFIHYILVSVYCMLSMITVHSVVFECRKFRSIIIFTLSWLLKSAVIKYLKNMLSIFEK